MKELKFVTPEPYEAPAILEIMPVTMVHGQDDGVSGNPNPEPDDPSGAFD